MSVISTIFFVIPTEAEESLCFSFSFFRDCSIIGSEGANKRSLICNRANQLYRRYNTKGGFLVVRERIYAFIDSQNLNLAIRAMGWKLDFVRFRIYIKDKYNVQKAFLFIGYIPGNESLYTYLQKSGYILVFKPVLETRKGLIKGNVDAELVLHTMIEINNYDRAMIVSGDGDFHCLIEYLIDKKKFAYLLIPNPKRFSSLLREFRKHFVYIHKLKQKLGQIKKRRSDLRTKP